MRVATTARQPLLAVITTVVLVVAGCGSPSAGGGAESGRETATWPLTLRYVIDVLDPEGKTVGRSVHVFAGRSWDDWVDVVVASDGDAAVGRRGGVQRYADDGLVAGALRDRRVIGDGAAFEEMLRGVLDRYPERILVAVDERGERALGAEPPTPLAESPSPLPVTSDEDLRGRRAPNAVFNPGLGGQWGHVTGVKAVDAEKLANQSGVQVAALSEVAARLGLPDATLARLAYRTEACERTCEAWSSVVLTATEIPLEVEWMLRDGSRYRLQVTHLEPGAAALD